MSDMQTKFQQLLRELFQFDLADLDFGIYRILNHKRQAIERWLDDDLPKAVQDELHKGALAEQEQARQALEEARQKVLETLGEEAIDAEGNLAEQYHNTKVGREYLEARAKAAHSQPSEALEAAVYNHLYTFFSRYYQDGDFISKRRYSKKERYAIPYNGEEVTLYWANHDQYYVKTAEHFTDYTWKAPNGVTVQFKLQAADVEVNNVKGDKRFFLPVLDGIAYSPLPVGEGPGVRGTLTIPFHYRPLTKQEEIAYGSRNQQESILQKALETIPARLQGNADALAALTAERRKDAQGNPVSWLEHHLRQYTARSTRDFFIHKDLQGFLSRELDFYLKNEVLNLDELEAAGEGLAEGWFQLMRLIKRVGNHIIDFLAQIEDFQKALWEKKKFVTETFWCVTVGHIPEVFYPEIAENEAQWQEWISLGFIPGNAGNADVSSVSSALSGVSSAKDTSPTPAEAEEKHKGWYSRGYLPHFDAGDVLQFITFRLHDSVPASVIEQWKQELQWREGLAADSKEAVELRKRIERYADSGCGACYLRDERIARLVQDALKYFDGERYRLIAWCIMPNHVHVLIEMMDESLPKIVQSWKSYTAHQANKLLGRQGRFWGPDYFDRYIRNEKHFNATVEYILQNPVKAGLATAPEQWPWCGYVAGNANVAGNADVSSVSDTNADTPSVLSGGRDVRDPGKDAKDAGNADTNADVSSGGRDIHAPGNPGRADVSSVSPGNPRLKFLKDHPTLVLDTRRFSPDFTDRLLASFENLDEMTDGLLVHAENWAALNLLLEKYRERVKTIYIDPPYNTDASAILYKNDYKHSSWLSLMYDRLLLGQGFLGSDGLLCVAIDDTEMHGLAFLICELFGENSILGTVSVRSNPAGRATLKGFSIAHEYALFVGNGEQAIPGKLPKSEEQIARYSEQDERGKFEWVNFRKHGGLNANRSARPKLYYPIYAKYRGEVRIPEIIWDEAKGEWIPVSPLGEDEVVIYPVNSRGEEKTWKWGHNTAKAKITDLTAKIDSDGRLGVYMKSRMSEGTLPRTLWVDRRYSATDYGTNLLTDILGISQLFSFPKSVYTVQDSLRVNNLWNGTLALDYFAGSGTTGHAVINLNREDGGWRKFILVEMGEYFDTVLLPRIKKVAFSPEWKDGKPKRTATQEEFERGPRVVKVLRLESYEDALNNITFDEQSGQQALDLFGDEYLLRYMLRWESRQSETLLDVAQLQSPFSYKLRIHRDGETRQQAVDLPETFAYLIGLDVERRLALHDGDRRYLVHRGTTRDGRRMTVIWRETQGWTKEDYERDAAFVAEHKLAEGADEVFVNGDSYIPGARSLDSVFKARLFGMMNPE